MTRIDKTKGVAIARGAGEWMTVSCEAEPFETGDVVRFVVRATPDNLQELLVKEIDVFSEGEALITLSKEDTLKLSAGDYVYGINIIRNGQEPQVLIREEKFRVQEAVARDEE